MSTTAPFPYLRRCSREFGVSPDALARIFAIEKAFHETILTTESADERKRQYRELYSEVHRLKRDGVQGEPLTGRAEDYTKLVRTFRRELEAKSILDVGCGNGLFLQLVAKLLAHGDLCGLDTSEVTLPQSYGAIGFLQEDVVSFNLTRQFEVIYSHQVLEHIAPADIPSHLRSIYAALAPGGRFIVLLPNKYWGPQDITRIVDDTFTGRVPAQGSHLNESSYTELVPKLEAFGFRNIRTVVPFAYFIPWLRGLRVNPRINIFLERHAGIRRLANKVRRHGRPIFKNPIVLICEKVDRPAGMAKGTRL